MKKRTALAFLISFFVCTGILSYWGHFWAINNYMPKTTISELTFLIKFDPPLVINKWLDCLVGLLVIPAIYFSNQIRDGATFSIKAELINLTWLISVFGLILGLIGGLYWSITTMAVLTIIIVTLYAIPIMIIPKFPKLFKYKT